MSYAVVISLIPVIVWAAVAGSRNEGGRPHFSSGVYDLTETILMTDSSEDPVGYKLVGTLTVDRVHDFLLLLKLDALQLQIMSRKAPTPLGFVEHASRLDELANDVQRPWLVKFSSFEPGTTHQRWNRVESIYVEPGEHLTIVNLKRGVTSLLQLSEEEGNTEEVDTSGLCSVSYLKDGNTIIKTKLNCTQPGNNKNNFLNDNVWGGRLNSRRETEATLGERGGFTEVTAEEWHSMSANLNPGLAVARLHVVSHLKLAEVKESTGQYGSSDVDSVVERLASGFKKYDLVINKEPSTCTHETCPTLAKLVSDSRKHLTATELGTAKSALAFIRLVRAIKSSTAEQIYAVINTAENKKILPQLMDVLGSAQCPSAHQAALKKLRINTGGKDFSLELAERYLWALSLSPNPTEAIVKDLIQIVKTGHKNEKLMYTLVLTLAATANKFAGVNSAFGQEIVQEVTLLIVEKLTACGDDQCRLVYLRSCSNFPAAIAQGGPIAEELVTTLLNHVVNSAQRCSVAALEALSKTEAWRHSQAVAQTCLRVYLSEGADTSARVLALDILLHQLMEDDGSRTERLRLATLLHPLSISTTPRELNQYLLQKIAQLSQLDSKGFGEAARATMLESGTWQWNVLATGGLSMAFERPVAPAASLSTSQEISNGVLKRGTVDVVLNHDTSRHSLFTLGLFSSGLSSFVSDSSSNNENEVVSAGLELRVAGVALRPFVFFNGQTELMGHVWSGTASSSTPAYQAIVMLGDTGTIEVVLGCGFIAELGITAAASVDLSGQIEISLWNRNAKSLVENSAGLAVVGIFKIESYLVKSQVEFNMITEPRLDLLSDLDFYNGVNLCLQLIQPQINLRLNSYKIERIGGSRHRLRKTRSSIVGPPVPARSYALNSKNNHMCSVIFGVPEDDTHT